MSDLPDKVELDIKDGQVSMESLVKWLRSEIKFCDEEIAEYKAEKKERRGMDFDELEELDKVIASYKSNKEAYSHLLTDLGEKL
jgi:hypothetical protein